MSLEQLNTEDANFYRVEKIHFDQIYNASYELSIANQATDDRYLLDIKNIIEMNIENPPLNTEQTIDSCIKKISVNDFLYVRNIYHEASKSFQYERNLYYKIRIDFGQKINFIAKYINFYAIYKDKINWKIYKNSGSTDLGFVLNCLFSGSITKQEFRQWIERVISELPIDNIPLYFFDLLEFDDGLANIIKIIGYSPVSYLSDDEDRAGYGIVYLRKMEQYEYRISKKVALKALKRNPHIYQRFKLFFPFIELPDLSVLDDFK